MEQAYKYRIYPNKIQEELIHKTFGCARWIYNHFLNSRVFNYKQTGKSSTAYGDMYEIPKLKKADDTKWLVEVDKFALQNAVRDLDTAFQNFFRGLKTSKTTGFPRYKSKKNRKKSYRTNLTNNNIVVGERFVKLPKLGKVKASVHRMPEGRILSATVSRVPSGEYFVSICCTEVEFNQYRTTGKSAGIDMGLTKLAVLSDGTVIKNPKNAKKKQKKLRRAQRALSRKKKGSRNRTKARVKVAKIHRDIANMRKDFTHQATTKLVREYDFISAETLSIQNMQKNHRLAGAIADAAWGEFLQQLEYKSRRHGSIFIKISQKFPSSQICNKCGTKNPEVRDLQVREWTCPVCGVVHDRDVNAALNILHEGIRLYKEQKAV